MAAAEFYQLFIVEGRYLGHGVRTLDRRNPIVEVPRSSAYFCPHCAEVWARFPVERVRDSCNYERFESHVKCCRNCTEPHSSRPSGELWLSYDKSFNDAMPLQALHRELLLLLNFYYPEKETA